jgi:acyl-CoA synthetase (AMP-forming)/AMP-acid ligase II
LTGGGRGDAGAFADLLPGVEPIETSARPGTAAGTGALPAVGPDDLAIVQFTSGSTARPKGVRLTHRNVVSGLSAISEGIGLGQGDGGGFWLPLFHDMGLFGTLSAVFAGIPAHIWSPLSFVKNPARWLREFAASGATITAMPNFGYDQLLGAVSADEAAEFDLRHWRISFNGAEPISHDSVQAFLERFAPAGFAPETMFGVYGMAEATLAVTFPPLGRAPLFEWVDRAELAATGLAVPVGRDAPGARAIAGVGRPVAGLRLRIADPDTGTDRPDGEVGEILIQGAPVTPGYLSQPVTDDFVDGWLRTGDLGYRRGDEVFVTGRRKEMIIVRGANVYPQDVEAVAREVPGVFRRRCVAVAAPDGSESMLVIAESTLAGAEADALRAGLAARIGAELGLAAVTVHLVAPRSIPRTSSGKVQRLAARDLLVPVP